MTQTHSNNYIADRNWRRLHGLQHIEQQSTFSKIISNKPNTEGDFIKSLAQHKKTLKINDAGIKELRQAQQALVDATNKTATTHELLAKEVIRKYAFNRSSKLKKEELLNGIRYSRIDKTPAFSKIKSIATVQIAKEQLIKKNPDMADDVVLTEKSKAQVVREATVEFHNCMPDVDLKYWIKRPLRRRHSAIEAIALHTKTIGNIVGNAICSQNAFYEKKHQIDRQEEWIKTAVITDGVNTFSLSDAGQTHKKKCNEIYAWASGIEQVATQEGMIAIRSVVSLKPCMHPNPANGNDTWDGTTPKVAVKYLQEQARLFNEAMKKNKLKKVGMWTREAQNDGTPHVNWLMFFKPEDEAEIRELFDRYFMHSNHAIDWEYIDKKTGGASWATYAMKFVSYSTKFILEDGTYDPRMLKERAWRSAWGIRAYGFFGAPPLTTYNRLRAQRIRPSTQSPLLQSMWVAARSNNVKQFIILSGGLAVSCKNRPLSIVRASSASGKSKIAIGVEEIETGEMIISKIIGQWTLKSLRDAVSTTKAKLVEPSVTYTENSAVTLSSSYPRKNQTPFKTLADFQKRRDLLHAPPLIH